MKTFLKLILLATISQIVIRACVFAQSSASPASGCKNSHKVVTPKNPLMGSDGIIVPGQALMQMKLQIDENTTVEVIEYPHAGKDLDSYNSTIIVKRGQKRTKYPIGQLIKYGSGLRLVEIASFCGSPGQGTLVLAFEVGSTGAAEGFAVIRFSPDTVDVQALPMANQGRIVISKADPDQVELWSATGSAKLDCDACKKHYAVQDCSVGQQSVECKQRPGPGSVLLPDKFMGARIVVR